MRIRSWVAAALTLAVLFGCREKPMEVLIPAVTPTATELSVWAAYWDAEAAKAELEAIPAGAMGAVCVFAAVFDENGALYLPDEAVAMYQELADVHADSIRLLTLVNDVVPTAGSPIQKDVSVLEKTLLETGSRSAHIAEIVTLAKAHGFGGVELDYEGVKHWSPELKKQFVAFCGELWNAVSAEDMVLRIVLEPSFPAGDFTMPAGPEYAVMLYNLYGYGTGPGPKADAAFLKKCADQFANLPGNVIWALAAGGFDWTNGASPAALTEQSAARLAALASSIHRDKSSGCVVFQYQDANGAKHEVWYADGETLRFWAGTLREHNGATRFALWRLGGNDPDSLKKFCE